MPQNSVYLIDPPSQFAPIVEWRRFLANLVDENARNPHPALQKAIAEAESIITGKR